MKIKKIAHIINPFHAPRSSDLFTAQPITFASMQEARLNCSYDVEIEFLSAQFPEDRGIAPKIFRPCKDLDRSVLDLGNFKKKMKLPFIHDILKCMYEESDADFLIYTNVDIGLYPNFYNRVIELIKAGHDAFMINRRRIPADYDSVKQLQEIYKLKGKSHPGFDCFVFHRSIFPKIKLNNICIGVPFIEITLSQNLFAFSKSFKLIEKEILTFHIGMEIFKGRAPREYFNFNRKEFWKSVNDPELRKEMNIKKLPYSELMLPIRLIKWGLHPCFPIRLMLRMEWENFSSSHK